MLPLCTTRFSTLKIIIIITELAIKKKKKTLEELNGFGSHEDLMISPNRELSMGP